MNARERNPPEKLDQYEAIFLAQVTSVASGSTPFAGQHLYTWAAWAYDNDTGLPEATDSPREGSPSANPATEVNNVLIDLASPVFVWMRYKTTVDGEALFEFTAPPLPLSASLSSYNTNTSLTSSYSDIGSAASLVAGNTYLIVATVNCSASWTAPYSPDPSISLRLQDVTNTVTLAVGGFIFTNASTLGQGWGQVTLIGLYTPSTNCSVNLQGLCGNTGVTAVAAAGFGSISVGCASQIAAVKL